MSPNTCTIPGDWGTVGADTTSLLLGRGSELITTDEQKVFPEEVEQIPQPFPGIRAAVGVGVTRPHAGTRSSARLRNRARRDPPSASGPPPTRPVSTWPSTGRRRSPQPSTRSDGARQVRSATQRSNRWLCDRPADRLPPYPPDPAERRGPVRTAFPHRPCRTSAAHGTKDLGHKSNSPPGPMSAPVTAGRGAGP